MTFHFVRSLTQIDLKSRKINLLSSNNVLFANNNFSQSRNTSNSSNSYDNIVVKSKRNRVYSNKDDDKRIANLANQRYITSTRFDVEQDIKRTKLFLLNDLHSFN